ISQVLVTDLANVNRIQTPAWHLIAVSSAKRRRIWGSAATTDASYFGYGNNYNRINFAPSTISATNTSEIDLTFEIPIAYSNDDLRGAIWGDTTQANMYLQLTLNPNM